MTNELNRRQLLQLAATAGGVSMLGGITTMATTRPAFAGDLELVEPGVLRVAYNGDMPGTGVKDGKLAGLDGEIMQWIGEQLGLSVKPVLMEWASEIEAVRSRRVDVMHGMMGWTAARTKVLNLTDPIYYVGVNIVQKKATRWSTLAELQGKRLGTIQGFTHVDQLKAIPGSKLMLYDTSDAAMRDVLAGRIDALFADPPLVQYAIQQNPDWNVHAVPLNQPYDPAFSLLTGKYNIVFGLSQQAPNLLAAFNEKIGQAWAECRNYSTATHYGLGDKSWFTPGEINDRAGADRPQSWVQPVLPGSCAA